VRFQVLTATNMKIIVFWDLEPCSLVETKIYLKIKRTGREADHSPSPSAETKSELNYTSTPLYVCSAWCLNKRQGPVAAH
jgi:hypothetical protein